MAGTHSRFRSAAALVALLTAGILGLAWLATGTGAGGPGQADARDLAVDEIAQAVALELERRQRGDTAVRSAGRQLHRLGYRSEHGR